VPNIEMHIYANGRHPGDALPDGTRMSGGLTDRNGIPYGTWQYRFIDWFRDLGFKRSLQRTSPRSRTGRTGALPPADLIVWLWCRLTDEHLGGIV